MDVEIRPSPSGLERRAVLGALGEIGERPSPYDSPWRRAGIEEDGRYEAVQPAGHGRRIERAVVGKPTRP